MTVLEKGKEPVESKLEDIYGEIYDRQVIWFSVENDNTIIIKLKEEWSHDIKRRIISMWQLKK